MKRTEEIAFFAMAHSGHSTLEMIQHCLDRIDEDDSVLAGTLIARRLDLVEIIGALHSAKVDLEMYRQREADQ